MLLLKATLSVTQLITDSAVFRYITLQV